MLRTINKIFALSFMIVAGSAHSAVYDFSTGIGTLDLNNASAFQGSIMSSDFGLYETEIEIEAFLNSSTYSFQVFNGEQVQFELDNSNSVWDLDISGLNSTTGNSASIFADSNSMLWDLTTPNEISSVVFFLRSTFDNTYLQVRQSNNISDSNFFNFEDGPGPFSIFANQPYDSTYEFNAVVPIPGALVLFSSGIIALVGFNLKRRTSVSD